MSSVAVRPQGCLKQLPEDFVVEEIPAYIPSGDGEHLYLWIEKRDFPAEQLLRHVARSLEISQSDIGCAGMKDRRAVTRQWLSVPAKAVDRIPLLESDRVSVLDNRRHGNKLRTGHLAGNRFTILVRTLGNSGADDEPVSEPVLETLQPALERMRQLGFANYFGDQRFGRDGETLLLGYDLLAGRKTPRDIPYSRRKFLLKLALSSVQSDLFNQTLAARIDDQLIATVLPGDVMEVVASGGKFTVDDVAAEQIRCAAGETALTGPMFGLKMKQPTGEPALREARILEQSGLTLDSFGGFGDLLSGTRRRYLIRPGELTAAAEVAGIRLQFTLPAGVYATTLVDELFETHERETAISDGTSDLPSSDVPPPPSD